MKKTAKYYDIAPLKNTMNFILQYLDISAESSFFFGIPVFNIRVSEYFMKGERELIWSGLLACKKHVQFNSSLQIPLKH